MEIFAWKLVLSTCMLFTVGFLSGLPVAVIEFSGEGRTPTFVDLKQTLGVLNSFAGGVFLATCMLDLLPDARRTVLDSVSSRSSSLHDYPIAELIAVFGVVLLLVMEICIEYCTERLNRHHRDTSQTTDGDISATYRDDVSATSGDDAISADSITDRESEPISKPDDDYTDETAPLLPSSLPVFSFRLLALVAALSIHSIFDGIAIGVQGDTASLTSIFVAILIHKSVFAFSLGVRLAEKRKPGRHSQDPVYLYLLCFAVATPVGIGIGAMALFLAGGVKGAGDIISGVLQSLAAGTLLYVTFFEILPDELQSKPSLLRIFALLFGLGVVAFLVGYVTE